MTLLRPPFDPEAMPPSIRRLTRDPRGYPTPWFVDRKAPLHNGGHDFRIMDPRRLIKAIREHRCWVCGGVIRRIDDQVFVAGPMCGINRTSAEPPSHRACAEWAVQACPFMNTPKRVRDDTGLPADVQVAGTGIPRNPGCTMLWASAGWTLWRPPGGGMLFDIGVPLRVDWWCQGRTATRAEVMDSVESGLPILIAQADREGPEAMAELDRFIARFLPLLPVD